MIKLMIVDDEAIIRQGLRRAVNWDEHGIEIVGEATGGCDAYKKAIQLHPDIVISDIRMVEESGLQFARKILDVLPQLKIIMLTGYSDMEYMMEAIKLGVRSYLLKPAGTEQILHAVLGSRDEILATREKERQNSRMEDLIRKNLDTLKERFLDELLSGASSPDAQKKADDLQIPLHGPRYVLLMVAPKPDARLELLQTISAELKAFAPVVNPRETGSLVAILNVDGAVSGEVMNRMTRRIGTMMDPMLRPCVSQPCGFAELPMANIACREMLSRSIWFDQPFLSVAPGRRFDDLPREDLLAAERNIVMAVRGNQDAAMAEHVDALLQLLERHKAPVAKFQEILLGIARSIRVFSEHNDLPDQLEALFLAGYDVKAAGELIKTSICGHYAQYGPQVRNALKYISENYMKELSLSDVASELYISPSYLTRLLKSKTGRGFNDWLQIMRIERAKELLEKSNLRHYEIAEKVGYHSYKIFSEYFSKLAGCSARAYRDNLFLNAKPDRAAPDAPPASAKR